MIAIVVYQLLHTACWIWQKACFVGEDEIKRNEALLAAVTLVRLQKRITCFISDAFLIFPIMFIYVEGLQARVLLKLHYFTIKHITIKQLIMLEGSTLGTGLDNPLYNLYMYFNKSD